MDNNTGKKNRLLRVGYLFTLMVLMPLALWALSGAFFLNELLRAGISYGFYRFLGYGGGQVLYVLLFNLFWYWIGLFSLETKTKSPQNHRSDIGCVVFLVCITLLATILLFVNGVPVLADKFFPPRISVSGEVVEAANQACKGLPVPEAAEYNVGTGLHPLVLVKAAGGWHTFTNKLSRAWKPKSISDIQLVACADEIQTNTYQVCNYTEAGQFTRYQETIDVRLVAAKTGELVEKLHIEGLVPPPCPDSISSSGDHSSTGTVNLNLFAALAKYVTP
jgi:hypothetical protein